MGRKKLIVILIENISLLGGTERAILSLARILSFYPIFNVKIISVSSVSDNSVFSVPHGVKVIHLKNKCRFIKKYIFLRKVIRKIDKEEKIDYLVSSGHNFSCFLFPFFLHSLKCIACEHLNRQMLPPYIIILQNIIYPKLWKVVVLTPREKQMYNNKNNILVIPNCIEELTVSRSNIQNVILAVGRLEKIKGFDLLIDAINSKKFFFENYEVRICGNGSEKENLQKKIDRYGLNEIVKIVPAHDLKEDYSVAKLFVLSSRCESFGLVLLEAMQNKIPCISFKSSGPEYILQNDDTILIDQDYIVLANKMIEICDNIVLQKKIVDKQITYLNEFTFEKISQIWMDNVFC